METAAHPTTTTATGTRDGRLVVRGVEARDLDAITEIANQPLVLRDTLGLPYLTVDAMKTRFDNAPKHTLTLCASIDERVAGFAVLEPSPPRRAHVGTLALSVHDAFQRRGVGTALLAALLDCADRSYGLRRVELTVFADNARAIALYRRFGFIEEGRSRAYAMRDGVLADALHLARFADAPAFASD